MTTKVAIRSGMRHFKSRSTPSNLDGYSGPHKSASMQECGPRFEPSAFETRPTHSST
jgi:hypothetical protein